MPQPSYDRKKRHRGMPSRSSAAPIIPISSSPSSNTSGERSIASNRYSEPSEEHERLPVASPVMDEYGKSKLPSNVLERQLKSMSDAEDGPERSYQSIRRRTDSTVYKNPVLVRLPSPVPAAPDRASPRPDRVSGGGVMEGPLIYPIYGLPDVSLESDLNPVHATAQELTAPRHMSAADALGSIVAYKHPSSGDNAPLPFAGRQLPGVYVHSIPSTSEPEPPSSPSDSDDASNRIHKPIEPLGHTSSPVLAKPPATTGQRSLHALEAVSQRIRRGAPLAPSISESSAPSTTSDEPPAAAPQGGLDEPKTNELVWARWESLDGRRLLIVGYYGGSVQMWDVTDLDLVHEVLHLTGMFTRSYPRTAHVLSKPPSSSHDVAADLFTRSRPLMALLLENAELVLYSLATHNIVKRVTSLSNSISSVSECDMQTGELFVAISTLASSQDAAVSILSAYDFTVLHNFPLASSAALPPFSLSRRLLAVPLPSTAFHSQSTGSLPSSIPTLKDGAMLAGSVKMEVASTARGMLKGMAAAASSAWGSFMTGSSQSTTDTGSARWPFSRSAPTESLTVPSNEDWSARTPGHHLKPQTLHRNPITSDGIEGVNVTRWIAVFDLQPLMRGSPEPIKLSHFPITLASTPAALSSPVACLSISPSGDLLAAADSDGLVIKVFHLRSSGPSRPRDAHLPPTPRFSSTALSVSPSDTHRTSSTGASVPRSRRRSSSSSMSRPIINPKHHSRKVVSPNESSLHPNVWHLYDLGRGMTRAKVESLVWAHDGRWLGVGTGAGTLHVFATNPYGGPTDEESHVHGRVINVNEFPPLSSALKVISRVRVQTSRSPNGQQMPARVHVKGPLFSFVFPQPAVAARSTSFNPRDSSMTVRPKGAKHRPPSVIPGFQDLLIVNTVSGRLELNRLNVQHLQRESEVEQFGTGVAALGTSPGTSISLPTSGLTQMMQAVRGQQASGLRAQQKPVASWNIQKDKEWEDVKGEFQHTYAAPSPAYNQDWLAQAELSTATTSRAMLPGSIYLSHQFSFYSLRDEWHAPLQRSQFDLPCSKIEVRKEVEISPFPLEDKKYKSGHSELLNQGPLKPGSAFDEPLASAIHARLDPTPLRRGVLPSYPNGLHSGPGWRDAAVPLRHAAAGISDGVGEGIGRLRREIGKVARSPRKGDNPGSSSLSFDETDTLEVRPHEPSRQVSGNEDAATLDAWDEWHEDVEQEVAEYEAFESLGGVVGEMDEDRHLILPSGSTSSRASQKETTPGNSTRRRRG